MSRVERGRARGRGKRPIRIVEISSSSSSYSDDIDDVKIIPTTQEIEDEPEEEPELEIKQDSEPVQTRPTGLLARYGTPHSLKITKKRAYKVTRMKEFVGGIRRKKFTIQDRITSEELGRAEYEGAFSSIIQFKNDRGVVSELETNGEDGSFILFSGNADILRIKRGPAHSIYATFMEHEDTPKPFDRLVSNPGSCSDIERAFGGRTAIKSVKNCRFCHGGREIVAVRKVEKNVLEVDADQNFSFFNCFALAVFLFLTK